MNIVLIIKKKVYDLDQISVIIGLLIRAWSVITRFYQIILTEIWYRL